VRPTAAQLKEDLLQIGSDFKKDSMFQNAEETYIDLKAQHASGKLTDHDFEAQAGKLNLQDSQGRKWQIGVQTGEWYMHDGKKWNKAKPPAS
jgi:hypothetical protein